MAPSSRFMASLIQALNKAKHDVDIARINRYIEKQLNDDQEAKITRMLEEYGFKLPADNARWLRAYRDDVRESNRQQDTRQKGAIDRRVSRVEAIKRKMAEMSSKGQGMM